MEEMKKGQRTKETIRRTQESVRIIALAVYKFGYQVVQVRIYSCKLQINTC
jgi:hypothetical protein